MFIYLFILFLLIFVNVRYDLLKKEIGYNFFYVFTYIIFVLVAGLRYKVGDDTINYMNDFDYSYPTILSFLNNGLGNMESRYDPLWILFVSICRSINDNFFFMQFIHSLIINTVYFYIIYKYTHNRFFTLLLYFLFGYIYFNTEIMRESMAIAVFLLSLNSYYNKKWIKYYVYAVIAMLFHSSALIVFLFPLLSRMKLNKWFFIILFTTILLSSFIWYKFMDQIEMFFFISSIQSKAETYIGNSQDYQFNTNGIIYGLFIFLFVPLLIVFFAKQNVLRTPKEIPFILVYLLLGSFVIYNDTVFTRFQNYLFFPFMIFFSNTIYYVKLYDMKKSLKNIIISVLFLFLIIGKYYSYFKIDKFNNSHYFYERYIPYVSILNKDKSPSYK